MASTYSTNLALELIGTGEQSGTWGTTTNNNLGTLIEQSISGYVTQAITDGSGANTTITIPNGATGVARNMVIEMTGALSFSTTSLIVPANKKLYFIFNNTTGGFAVTVKVSGQTGVLVPNGKKVILTSNGTDIVEAANQVVGAFGVGGTATMAVINASGVISSANSVESTGQLQTYAANKIAMSQESASNSMLTAHGTDASTYGILTLRTAKSTGAPVNTMVISGAGAVTIPGTLGVGGAAVGFGNGYNEITIATGANGSMLYLQGTGPVNHRLYGNGVGVTYDASGATAHQFVNNGVNTLGISSAGAVTINSSVASYAMNLNNTSGSSPNGLSVYYSSGVNSTGNPFLFCSDGASVERATIRSNGGLANFSANNVNLSDIRTKKNIELAGDYLLKICAIPVKTFLYKDQTDELLNLGVIAQDVEAVAPELIDDSGWGILPKDGTPLKAIYQTDLQFALMRCIQELKAENESLTIRIAALEAK